MMAAMFCDVTSWAGQRHVHALAGRRYEHGVEHVRVLLAFRFRRIEENLYLGARRFPHEAFHSS
jgi:hypothetical protein